MLVSSFSVAHLRGRPKFLHFHAIFSKNWQNHRLAPLQGLAPPPRGNPGSVTAFTLGTSRIQSFWEVDIFGKFFCPQGGGCGTYSNLFSVEDLTPTHLIQCHHAISKCVDGWPSTWRHSSHMMQVNHAALRRTDYLGGFCQWFPGI